MQICRVKLSDETAYLFARLQDSMGGKSSQRTFDELLNAAWYLITQGAEPSPVRITSDGIKEITTLYNFDLVNEGYEQKFAEIKRRLSLKKGSAATNIETVTEIVRLMYAHYAQTQTAQVEYA